MRVGPSTFSKVAGPIAVVTLMLFTPYLFYWVGNGHCTEARSRSLHERVFLVLRYRLKFAETALSKSKRRRLLARFQTVDAAQNEPMIARIYFGGGCHLDIGATSRKLWNAA